MHAGETMHRKPCYKWWFKSEYFLYIIYILFTLSCLCDIWVPLLVHITSLQQNQGNFYKIMQVSSEPAYADAKAECIIWPTTYQNLA